MVFRLVTPSRPWRAKSKPDQDAGSPRIGRNTGATEDAGRRCFAAAQGPGELAGRDTVLCTRLFDGGLAPKSRLPLCRDERREQDGDSDDDERVGQVEGRPEAQVE